MEGLFINKAKTGFAPAGIGSEKLRLLAKGDGVEIMAQNILRGATVWLVPAQDPSAMEFFFIFRGELSFTADDCEQTLGPGESFYICGLKKEVLLKANQETALVYISNRPLFEESFGFQEDLTKLLIQINDKDNYTFQHSRNVMRYCVNLYEMLCDHIEGITVEDMVMAALFHDVGKCYTPDEILKKNGKLEPDEYRYIKRHPIDSGRLLGVNFGERIAEIARNHHERLDGSGYPLGLTEKDISFEARIVAVADVFDAMTSERSYNQVKAPLDAALELYHCPNLFDAVITRALLDLVRSENFKFLGGAVEKA